MATTKNQLDLGGVSPTFNTLYLGATRPGAMNGTELTATAAELNARAAGASRVVSITDAASYTVLAANSGKIHIIPDFTSTCTATLPTIAAGLEYTFISKAVAADAQNFVITSPSPVLKGGVCHLDADAGAASDELVPVYPNGSSHVTLTLVTPAGGTKVYVVSDGTNWIVNGLVVSATVPAFS